jgi:hypothetical protein
MRAPARTRAGHRCGVQNEPRPRCPGEMARRNRSACYSRWLELVFFRKASKTLILSDAIINLELDKMAQPWRLATRLIGMYYLGGQLFFGMRLPLLLQRKKSRAAIERVLAWRPERIISATGAVSSRTELQSSSAFSIGCSNYNWLTVPSLYQPITAPGIRSACLTVAMVRDVMLHPQKLRECMEFLYPTSRELARITSSFWTRWNGKPSLRRSSSVSTAAIPAGSTSGFAAQLCRPRPTALSIR